MRNIIGSPTGGDDFFDRHSEIRQLRTELDNDANILLTAPRRVGKTSLALKLCDVLRQEKWCAAFFDAESCTDETEFVEALIRALREKEINLEGVHRVQGWLGDLRKYFDSVGGNLFSVKFRTDQGSFDDQVRSLFDQPAKEGWKLLIVVDELPVMLNRLLMEDKGAERAREFLHWLRELRQAYRGSVQWMLLGSIGLNSFTETRGLTATINDLTAVSLGAFLEVDAHAFLEKLGDDNYYPLSYEIRSRILEIVGWALPYHLQLMFHALRELEGSPSATGVDRAFESLLDPAKSIYFDTWRQRLAEQLEPAGAAMAMSLLTELCRHNAGRTRPQLHSFLMRRNPTVDPEAVQQQLSALIQILQRDGYLAVEGGKYLFRSFLLREYWRRREVL